MDKATIVTTVVTVVVLLLFMEFNYRGYIKRSLNHWPIWRWYESKAFRHSITERDRIARREEKKRKGGP